MDAKFDGIEITKIGPVYNYTAVNYATILKSN